MPRLQAQKITIPLHSIGVDELNPRLPPQQSQREAIRAMVEQQGEKIVHLAADIAEHGLSEAERFMAMVPDNRRFPYISLDGNRRLVALKLLHEPLLAEGVLAARWLTRLKKLSEEFANDPIDEVELAVFDSREHGALWVARRHSANLNGVGQDAWESIERHRFDAWRGVESREWQVLQFVQEHGNLSPEDQKRLHKLPISTLLRLLSDTYVKQQLGLEYRNNRVVTTLPNEEIIKPLRRILLDLLDKKVDVTMLDGKEDRKRYIDSLDTSDRPSPKAIPTHFHRLGQKQRFIDATEVAALAVTTKPTTLRTAARKIGQERITIIPSTCHLIIGPPRIREVYQELQVLDANTHPTAGAMLLRLFVEASLDHCLAQLAISIPADTALAEKLQATAKAFSATGALKEPAYVYMYENLQADKVLLPTVSQLNTSIYSQAAAPLAADLRRHWDNLQAILHLIWS
jgi:hypothetical protein